jgi:hypothetical protein
MLNALRVMSFLQGTHHKVEEMNNVMGDLFKAQLFPIVI